MTLADSHYWDRYWKSLDRDERLNLANLLLDRDSGEVDWVGRDDFNEFPNYIKNALLHIGEYKINDTSII